MTTRYGKLSSINLRHKYGNFGTKIQMSPLQNVPSEMELQLEATVFAGCIKLDYMHV